MKKNENTIYKRIFFIVFIAFINFNLFAQKPFYKKRKWGVNFGLNYYYPVIDGYSYHSGSTHPWGGDGSRTTNENRDITLTGNVGKYLGISRTIRLYKINEKNSLNLLVGLSYNQRKAILRCSGTKETVWESSNFWDRSINCINEEKREKDEYPCLDLKLTNIINFKEKYEIYNAVGFRTNTPNFRFHYQEYYLTYSLGFLFYLKKINIMFYIDHSVFNLRNLKNFGEPIIPSYYPYPSSLIENRGCFNLTNFGISIFFNKPLKNKKNEEK